jgi:hypothetical protein
MAVYPMAAGALEQTRGARLGSAARALEEARVQKGARRSQAATLPLLMSGSGAVRVAAGGKKATGMARSVRLVATLALYFQETTWIRAMAAWMTAV